MEKEVLIRDHMNVGMALTAVVAVLISPAAFAENIIDNSLYAPEMPELKPLQLKWNIPSGATMSNGWLVVEQKPGADGKNSKTTWATAEVDLDACSGRGVEMRIVAEGRDLGKPDPSYFGFKFMLQVCFEKGAAVYPSAGAPATTFGPTELTMRSDFIDRKIRRATLHLGLQAIPGRVAFDLSTLRMRVTPYPFPRVNAGHKAVYTPEIRERAKRRFRGVMSPGRRMTEDDFRTLADWGANLIRYQMRCLDEKIAERFPNRKTDEKEKIAFFRAWIAESLRHLEEDLIPWARKYGMMIVVDAHAVPGGKEGAGGIFTSAACGKCFCEVWREIAMRFKGCGDVIYGYDLVNEPNQRGCMKYDYWTIQKLAANVIRRVDPTTPIIVESNGADAPETFRYLSPLTLDNIIYQVHMYMPFDFTHQGIGVVPKGAVYPDPSKGWDIDKLESYLKPVYDFAARHDALIYVGEFSAINWAKGAEDWMRDAIEVFERHGTDWTFHAFREWPPWSVEHIDGFKPSDDNPRKRALLDGFRRGASKARWTKERAWKWYEAQPWICGCNYMPASCANRVDQWQKLGSEERFAEMDRELAVAEKIGLNALRLIVGDDQGFGVWFADHDGYMTRLELTLEIAARHGMRAILVLGNDCSRPKAIWKLPTPGPQPYDIGYHGGRKLSQHGSFAGQIGYTVVDDPELSPKWFAMCEELLRKYRMDKRILFWNIWNEPGNNGRDKLTEPNLRKLFELAWRIDPEQPLAADVWRVHGLDKDVLDVQAATMSDIISFHCYEWAGAQSAVIRDLKSRFGRPLVNTEWLARTFDCTVDGVLPLFQQQRVGCMMWGFVNGKYQTHEPWEGTWKEVENGRMSDPHRITRWFHDLLRPSLRPYDPVETNVLTHLLMNAAADRAGASVRARIARSHKIIREDLWQGFRRTEFDFKGHKASVVEPTVAEAEDRPWTWTMQWWDAFVDRTGVPDLLCQGYHHVWIDLFETRMDDTGVALAVEFQRFLVDELGFAPKANLIGMSWGGFFSTRYAAAHPENVARIYYDAPLMNFDGFGNPDYGRIGVWANNPPPSGKWSGDPRMPVNMAEKIAAAKIPILILYGGQDQAVPPALNCERFLASFKSKGGEAEVEKRDGFGHHPHGLDPNKTERIVRFFKGRK